MGLLRVLAAVGLAAALGAQAAPWDMPPLDKALNYRPKQPLQVVTSDGVEIAAFGAERRQFVPIERIPRLLQDAVRVLQYIGVGVGAAREWLARFGLDVDKQPDNLTLALGTGSVTPMQMAQAFATIANGGWLRAVAWMGYSEPKSLGEHASGASLALPIWIDFMSAALTGVAPAALAPPQGLLRSGSEWLYEELAVTGHVEHIAADGSVQRTQPFAPPPVPTAAMPMAETVGR
jgi:membrane carboxypeptidase/penicillin-binding protein